MKGFITFIIIIIIFVLVFSFFWNVLKIVWENILASFQGQKTPPPKKSGGTKPFVPNPIIEPEEPKPDISIDTHITFGPEEGEIIDDISEVTFEFEEKLSLEDVEGKITFETKIEGFDENWISTSSKKRTVKLPHGPKEYEFLVRTKIQDSVDPTPATRTFKINTSPYFGKIKISTVKYQSSSDPSLITLSTQLTREEKINITNWSVNGNKGKIIIPQGIEKYKTFASPQNIFVKQSDKIYLVSGSNPWGGANPLGKNKNFRVNKCFGYLLDNFDFYPSISKNCPLPNKLEQISHLNESCQEFILDIRKCEIPDYSDNIKITFDMECRGYMDDNFNYNSCFENYQQDENFLKNYWHVYLNTDIVKELHDILYLRDRNGLLVDEYLY